MINIGIIGYGKMGQARHKALKKLKSQCKVILISDINQNKNRNKLVYNFTENYMDVIKNYQIDVIFICTPNFLNKKLTILALKNKKHVFCEKPPTLNYKELKKVIECEKKYGSKLMYGFNHRHHQSIIKMKKIIDDKIYGNILWMRGRYGKSVNGTFNKNWRSKKELSGGGILIDQGIHLLDLFIYLGGKFDEIKSVASSLYWKSNIEDNVFAILKNNKTGLSASFHSTMTQWRHLFSLEIFFEKGYITLNGLKTSSGTYGKEVLTIAKNRSTTPAATHKSEKKYIFNVDNSIDEEVKIFINFIIKDKQVDIGSSNEAMEIMKIIYKIYKQNNLL